MGTVASMINDFTSRWHWWDDTDGRKRPLETSPSQCQFIHYYSHNDPPGTEKGSTLNGRRHTAWAITRPPCTLVLVPGGGVSWASCSGRLTSGIRVLGVFYIWGRWSRFLCFNAARKQANFAALRIKVRRIATASCDIAQTDALQVTSMTGLNPPRNNSVWIGLKEAGRPYSCTADSMRRFSNQIVYDVTRIFLVLCSRLV